MVSACDAVLPELFKRLSRLESAHGLRKNSPAKRVLKAILDVVIGVADETKRCWTVPNPAIGELYTLAVIESYADWTSSRPVSLALNICVYAGSSAFMKS